MTARLVFLSGTRDGSTQLLRGSRIRIGRNPDSDVTFDAHAELRVGRDHARIEVDDGRYTLVDLDSTNGTLVNGRPVTRHLLSSGDVIEFGRGGPRARFEGSTSESPFDAEDGSDTVFRYWEAESAVGGSESAIVRRTIRAVHETSKRRARWVVLAIGVAGTLALLAVWAVGDRRGEELETALATATRQSDAFREEAQAALAAQAEREAGLTAELAEANRRLGALDAGRLAERREIRQRIDSLEAVQGGVSRFQEIASENRSSLVYIYACAIMVRGTETLPLCGSGTGFVVAEEGYVVTNKHVVTPWLTSLERACAIAFWRDGGFSLEGPLIAAWKEGTRMRDPSGDFDLTAAFTTADGSLALVATAPHESSVREAGWTNCEIHDPGGGPPSVEQVEMDWERPTSPLGDLALLKLGSSGHRAVRMGTDRPDDLAPVMAFGFPLGTTPLEGDRAVAQPTLGEIRKVELTIQHTAAISPGNSGGPLFDADGDVIGVNVAHFVSGQVQNIAIPIEYARRLLEQHVNR